MAQFTAEAEYVAAATATNQAIWLRKVFNDVKLDKQTPTVLYVDNKFAIAIAKNPVMHGRTKHINVKYHTIREAERNQEIKLIHCSTDDQLVNILTKVLFKAKFEELREKVGIGEKSH